MLTLEPDFPHKYIITTVVELGNREKNLPINPHILTKCRLISFWSIFSLLYFLSSCNIVVYNYALLFQMNTLFLRLCVFCNTQNRRMVCHWVYLLSCSWFSRMLFAFSFYELCYPEILLFKTFWYFKLLRKDPQKFS